MKKTFLMCEPRFYNVEYVINPHMNGNIGNVDHKLAHKQWKHLYDTIARFANIELIEQAPGLPDMVFTANAGLVLKDDKYVIASSFAKPERRGEERLFKGWFLAAGFDVIRQSKASFFEGAGDALVDAKGDHWLGYGFRSTLNAVQKITKAFAPLRFHTLELKDPHFYHLDTCFAPLSKGHYLWYPDAFTTPSYWAVAAPYRSSGVFVDEPPKEDMLIDVDEEDAHKFACNAVCIDENVIIPQCSDKVLKALEQRGYNPIAVDMSEFIKAGGAAKCLTLQIA